MKCALQTIMTTLFAAFFPLFLQLAGAQAAIESCTGACLTICMFVFSSCILHSSECLNKIDPSRPQDPFPSDAPDAPWVPSLCKHLTFSVSTGQRCSSTHLTLNVDILAIKKQVHQWVTAQLSRRGSTVRRLLSGPRVGNTPCRAAFLFLVFWLLWWLFGRWLMWTTMSDHAGKCSRHQIKKLPFPFFFNFILTQLQRRSNQKKKSNRQRQRKVIHVFF